jgi:hypothetical protein
MNGYIEHKNINKKGVHDIIQLKTLKVAFSHVQEIRNSIL